MRNFMLTSILLETKYVTTLLEISSSLRNFQTFKCHEKALSKPCHYIRVSYVWKLGMLSFLPHTFSG